MIGITGRCQNLLVMLNVLSIFHSKVGSFSENQKISVGFLSDLIAIRDGQLFLAYTAFL